MAFENCRNKIGLRARVRVTKEGVEVVLARSETAPRKAREAIPYMIVNTSGCPHAQTIEAIPGADMGFSPPIWQKRNLATKKPEVGKVKVYRF